MGGGFQAAGDDRARLVCGQAGSRRRCPQGSRERVGTLIDDSSGSLSVSQRGFTEAGRYWYAEIFLPMPARHVEVVDPWALTSAEETASALAAGP